MIHAFNGGFYNKSTNGFCLSKPSGGACQAGESTSNPRLGAELWAYVPYNLLPHLKCLMDPTYDIDSHKFYVDLKPSVFDVQIFDDDANHPNGWGTILVMGMRMGGSPVAAADLMPGSTDERIFRSAYVILDITNPEEPPVLLGEITHNAGTVDMGYTTASPVVVPIKKDISSTSRDDSEWYLLLGHGPDSFDGTSTRDAGISVFPLKKLAGVTNLPSSFRIPADKPVGTSTPGTYTLTGSPNGFVSNPIVVDYNLDFKADAIYFGTIEGTWGNWGGKFYRFPTNTLAGNDGSGISPNLWGTTNYNDGPSLMYDPDRPITTAASIGWDGRDYWLYFGTGRFFDVDDKTDSSSNAGDTYYGFKEPVILATATSGDEERNYTYRSDGFYDFSWSTISNTAVPSETFSTDQGDRGLVDVTGVRVDTESNLSCSGTGCSLTYLGNDPTLKKLENYIGDYADGWKKDFTQYRERNLGQATLLGGLVTFTSYVPYESICEIDGFSYVYGLYYKTGTAWYMPVFGETEGETSPALVVEKLSLGRGLAETPNLHLSDGGGDEGDADDGGGIKAFIQTTTGTIVEVPQESLPIKNYRTGKTSWKGLSIE